MIIKERRGPQEIPSSSMADIAFLLLIFFLLTTTMSMDKGINIVLPPPGQEEIEIPKENITNILINQAGKVLLDNKPFKIRDIAGFAERAIARNKNMIFSVQPHPKTKYDVYVQVLDQLKMAKAKKISIANPTE
ncbi:MAG: biopolymer transporter ExbD [FCB group bacterium]|nr:biopolymer transporter ExbD [FCB group bacterium]